MWDSAQECYFGVQVRERRKDNNHGNDIFGSGDGRVNEEKRNDIRTTTQRTLCNAFYPLPIVYIEGSVQTPRNTKTEKTFKLLLFPTFPGDKHSQYHIPTLPRLLIPKEA
jgi:hypothetical protein